MIHIWRRLSILQSLDKWTQGIITYLFLIPDQIVCILKLTSVPFKLYFYRYVAQCLFKSYQPKGAIIYQEAEK